MRYEKVENLMHLALEMQAAHYGVSLAEIESKFNVCYRTAMRMRDAVVRIFPQAEEVEKDDGTKRWRIPSGTLNGMITLTASELALLDAAAKLLKHDNREDEAGELSLLSAKLKALLQTKNALTIDPDLETLLESEGLAARPGPRPIIRADMVRDIRQAIMGCRKIKISYRNRRDKTVKTHVVHPYGFLHGHRNYLVGWLESNEYDDEPNLLALPYIEAMEITDSSFERNLDFDLNEFASRSFGVFQGEEFETIWKFSPEAAEDAKEFVFHPSQVIERHEDGSLIVKFTATGELEMAWHLYTWGDKVTVISPQSLADMVENHQVPWPALP